MPPLMVCLSGGGFMSEMKGLLTHIEPRLPMLYALPRVERRLLRGRFPRGHFFVVANVSRGRRFGLRRNPLFWAACVRRYLRKMRIHRPEFAVVTSSVDSLPCVIAAKLLGVKVIFVESITRTRSLSRTGQLVYHLRLYDHYFVQWPKLRERYARAQFDGVVTAPPATSEATHEPGMVLVTVGSTYFDEMVEQVDRFYSAQETPPKILFQIGSGTYIPKSGQWVRFTDSLADMMARSDLIVTHGGFTVLEAASRRKKVIAVPNPTVADDHQRIFVNDVAPYLDVQVANTVDEIPRLLASDIPPAHEVSGGFLGDRVEAIVTRAAPRC